MATNSTKPTYFPQFRIYKPTKSNSGAASAIQTKLILVKDRWELQLFWVATQQVASSTENAAFAWADKEKTVTMKLGDPDVGELLTVLSGISTSLGRKEASDKPGKGLFHQNAGGNTTMTFQAQRDEKTGELGYWLRLASKSKAGKLVEVKHRVTAGEGELLRSLLNQWVVSSYGWDGLYPVGMKADELPVASEESAEQKF